MVFFMVFIARSKAENIDTMREKIECWHGIRELELRVLWSHSGNPLYLLHMASMHMGYALAISDGVVDPGGHVVHG